MKTKIDAAYKDIDSNTLKIRDLERNVDDRFVTLAHFESVFVPIQNQLASIQTDIKDLLKLVIKGKNEIV